MVPNEGLQAWQDKFLKGLETGLDDLAAAIHYRASEIIEDEAIDKGDLLRSGEVRSSDRFSREVVFTAAHALPTEFGSRPHWPPFKPILEWVKRKLSVDIVDGKKTYRLGKNPTGRAVRATKQFTFKDEKGRPWSIRASDAHVDVARAVQAKIARDGTKGVAFLLRSIRHVQPQVGRILRDAFKRTGAL